MHLSLADQQGIHLHSIRHRAAILRSKRCGCFHCLAFFAPAEIMDWVDVSPEAPASADEGEWGQTALCPRCGIDAVLPDTVPGVVLSTDLLHAMQRHWF